MTSKSLTLMPRIDVLRLARVTGVPAFHPEHAAFQPFPVFGFLIHHLDHPIVVDTGIGFGDPFIDSQYPHESVSLVDELHRFETDERDVGLIINSHLHFDHCGQNGVLGCPVVVQRAEIAAAAVPRYTVPAWATIPARRSRAIDGDVEVAPGVTAMLTPGHTPGHQAIVIRGGGEVVVIAAQCIFRSTAWNQGAEATNLHDASWHQQASESLLRLQALRPNRVLVSHDDPIVTTQTGNVDGHG